MKKIVFVITILALLILISKISAQGINFRFNCTINGAQKVVEKSKDLLICDVLKNSEIEIILTAQIYPPNLVNISALEFPKELKVKFNPSQGYGSAYSTCKVKIPENITDKQYELIFAFFATSTQQIFMKLKIILRVKDVLELPHTTYTQPMLKLPLSLPITPRSKQRDTTKSSPTVPSPSTQTPTYNPYTYTSQTDNNGSFILKIPDLKNTTLKGKILNANHQPIKNIQIKITLIPKDKKIRKVQDIVKIVISSDKFERVEIMKIRLTSSIDLKGNIETTIWLGDIIVHEIIQHEINL